MFQPQNLKLAFLRRELFLPVDSVGFDCVYQYAMAKRLFGTANDVTLFSEKFDPAKYPGIQARSFEDFKRYCIDNPDCLVVNHVCEAWPEFEDFIMSRPGRLALRWHNITPPWFFMSDNTGGVEAATKGYRALARLGRRPNTWIWPNSAFTGTQAQAICGGSTPVAVVYGSSRYLDSPRWGIAPGDIRRKAAEAGETDDLNIMFVSRIVVHKGWLHLIEIGRAAQMLTRRKVRVHIVGRMDPTLKRFNKQLRAAAASAGIEVLLHNEVPEEKLRALYDDTHVFVCMSEHEGFGAPNFEAMRCGIPVVAWASTAVKEVLKGHPFAFPEFDIPSFASAVVLATDPKVLEKVQVIQERIVATYTPETVAGQFRAALARAFEPTDELAFVFDASLLGGNASARGDAMANDLRGGLGRGYAPPVHDSPANLMSLRDIEAYEIFLKEAIDPRGLKLLAGESIFYSAEDLSGEIANDLGTITLDRHIHDRGHAIYGPYAPIPKGWYEAIFQFRGRNNSARPVTLTVDAACRTSGIAKIVRLEVPSGGEAQDIVCPFEIAVDSDVIEYRIEAGDFTGCAFEFAGVTIRKVPPPLPPEPPRTFLQSLFGRRS